jgi:hypothetical protein
LTSYRDQIKAWLTVLRLPNLLTVPGDPLAGFLLAAASGEVLWARVPASLAASLCFYGAGLLSNDFFDIDEDARERPNRPLPAGLIEPYVVFGVALGLTLLGVMLAASTGAPATIVAFVLCALVWTYNTVAKRSAFWGPLVMGLCRALNLLMGAAAGAEYRGFSEAAVVVAAVGLFVYIVGVSRIARNETGALPVGGARWVPVAAVFSAFALLLLLSDAQPAVFPATPAPVALAMLATTLSAVWTVAAISRLGAPAKPAVVIRSVGLLIRGLPLFQAALCALAFTSVSPTSAFMLLSAFAVTGWLSRGFYSS